MNYFIQFALLIMAFLALGLTTTSSAPTGKPKEIKIDNRLICMRGKKGAKLNEIEYAGTARTGIDLRTFFKQFTPRHVIPKESKKNSFVSPKFIKGTLTAIARRECKQFEKEKKLEKDEVFGIVFPNGKQLLSLFHDEDFKWNGSGAQLKWNWPELAKHEDIV